MFGVPLPEVTRALVFLLLLGMFMRGSLAVWCEADGVEVDGHEPQLELHFNIWGDLPEGNSDVLDIGVLFKDSRTLKRLLLYIPEEVKPENLRDLSPILRDQTTLSAVFNDTLSIGESSTGYIRVIRDDKIAFHIVQLNFEEKKDVSVESFSEEDDRTGTIIAFEEELIRKMDHVGDHYVRFRVELSGSLRGLFVSTIEPSDRVFLSSFYKNEMIEFRVNEKRNFSQTLRERRGNAAKTTIAAVHYFLVRELHVEMVQAHTTFHKMRRLEWGLWNHYLQDLGKPDPEKMIIYHWRKIADKNSGGIDDFIALTVFREPVASPAVYVIAIAFLGAIGSAVQSLFSSLVIIKNKSTDNLAIQLAVIVLLGLILLIIYAYFSNPFRLRFRSLWRSLTRSWHELTSVIQGRKE
jgi:hypothetical protein